ncbi:unnamed protein product [Prorocentrum cordatum]|uniref:Uncharacterized protein n=1 Tax=Prorocentrum cordatum TaxID=2364126 RepID=A0ABN9RSJ6_9DINO|nr:unnamed protein product [Polarella glacialis]
MTRPRGVAAFGGPQPGLQEQLREVAESMRLQGRSRAEVDAALVGANRRWLLRRELVRVVPVTACLAWRCGGPRACCCTPWRACAATACSTTTRPPAPAPLGRAAAGPRLGRRVGGRVGAAPRRGGGTGRRGGSRAARGCARGLDQRPAETGAQRARGAPAFVATSRGGDRLQN